MAQVSALQLLLLATALLPGCLCVLSADTGSLCFNFTIRAQSRPGQPWCQVWGSMDAIPFFHYEGNSSKPVGSLGKEINSTKIWTELTQAVREVGMELRTILPNIKLDKNKTRGPPTLQAKMLCECEKERSPCAFWNFTINGQYSFHFDSMNKKWTLINPEAKSFMEKWKNNRETEEYFRKISIADCPHWLKGILKRRMEVPGTTECPDTSQHPIITQHPSNALHPSNAQHTSHTIRRKHRWIPAIPVVLWGVFSCAFFYQSRIGRGVLSDSRVHRL